MKLEDAFDFFNKYKDTKKKSIQFSAISDAKITWVDLDGEQLPDYVEVKFVFEGEYVLCVPIETFPELLATINKKYVNPNDVRG